MNNVNNLLCLSSFYSTEQVQVACEWLASRNDALIQGFKTRAGRRAGKLSGSWLKRLKRLDRSVEPVT